MTSTRKYHIGIIGTGFIARGLLYSLKYRPQIEVSSILTRRPIKTIKNLPVEDKLFTHNIERVIRKSDLVVECTGDAVHGTEMVEQVLKAGIPVVTMNPELQITSGTILSQMGTLIEAEGDQPGTLAALDAEVRSMGFKPIVYGNIKGFLNLNPALKEMQYWAKQNGISLPQVTAFTDGSKVQIEQALVANGLCATIVDRGLAGIKCKNYEDGASRLGELADKVGEPISDYVLSPGSPAGVFIVAKHDKEQAPYLKYLKLGDGPNYTIVKPYHLCHLEIAGTITKVLLGDTSYSFNNGRSPTIQVMAVTKREIRAGETIERGLGGFDVRGEAVKIRDFAEAVPITLIHKAEFVKTVGEGQVVTFEDVRLPETRALTMWEEVLSRVGARAGSQIKQKALDTEDVQVQLTPQQPKKSKLAALRSFAGLRMVREKIWERSKQ